MVATEQECMSLCDCVLETVDRLAVVVQVRFLGEENMLLCQKLSLLLEFGYLGESS
jgi:hypothetical protein